MNKPINRQIKPQVNRYQNQLDSIFSGETDNNANSQNRQAAHDQTAEQPKSTLTPPPQTNQNSQQNIKDKAESSFNNDNDLQSNVAVSEILSQGKSERKASNDSKISGLDDKYDQLKKKYSELENAKKEADTRLEMETHKIRLIENELNSLRKQNSVLKLQNLTQNENYLLLEVKRYQNELRNKDKEIELYKKEIQLLKSKDAGEVEESQDAFNNEEENHLFNQGDDDINHTVDPNEENIKNTTENLIEIPTRESHNEHAINANPSEAENEETPKESEKLDFRYQGDEEDKAPILQENELPVEPQTIQPKQEPKSQSLFDDQTEVNDGIDHKKQPQKQSKTNKIPSPKKQLKTKAPTNKETLEESYSKKDKDISYEIIEKVQENNETSLRNRNLFDDEDNAFSEILNKSKKEESKMNISRTSNPNEKKNQAVRPSNTNNPNDASKNNSKINANDLWGKDDDEDIFSQNISYISNKSKKSPFTTVQQKPKVTQTGRPNTVKAKENSGVVKDSLKTGKSSSANVIFDDDDDYDFEGFSNTNSIGNTAKVANSLFGEEKSNPKKPPTKEIPKPSARVVQKELKNKVATAEDLFD